MVVKSIETKIKEIIKERGLQQKYVCEKNKTLARTIFVMYERKKKI